MAYKYHGQGELEDLEQEGFLALYDAIDHYEADQGVSSSPMQATGSGRGCRSIYRTLEALCACLQAARRLSEIP